MKYLIMCGGTYTEFTMPRQLIKVNGEELVARTIRLLHENGIENQDIWITSNNPIFDKFGLTRKTNENNTYLSDGYHPNSVSGFWVDALYPMDEPCCYLFGDVFYSEEAMKTIVNTPCEDNILFGVVPTKTTLKKWKEPLGLKIVDNVALKRAISDLKQMWLQHDPKLHRHPIIWEVFTQLNNLPFFPSNYCLKSDHFVGIKDYCTDVDHPEDAAMIEYFLKYGTIKDFDQSKAKIVDKSKVATSYIGGNYFGL